MARRPPKFQRFIGPAKPLPIVTPVTSTILSDGEMVGGDLGPDRNELVLRDAELGELHLRLDLGDGEAAALGLGHVLHLGPADAELKRGVAVLFLRPMRDDLAALDLEDRDRHVLARIGEDAGHAELLCDDA